MNPMRSSTFLAICMTLAATAVSRYAYCAPAEASHAITEMGTQGGADYRIDMPAKWNHELIVFYHGYSTDAIKFSQGERISPMFDPMLQEGFAIVQSGYSGSGWAVEEGYSDTEHLREYFIHQHGQPKQTYVMGMSMGGTLTSMTIESRPEVYVGALSLCGAIEPTNGFMQRDFALRAAFDYYFPKLLGPLVPVPADYIPDEASERKVAAALATNPRAVQSLLRFYGAADARSLAPVIAFNTFEAKEMQQRTHGNPFGNEDLIYTGTGDDFALNDGVHRYHAEPGPLAKMSRWYTPTGKLTRPMLALHDSGDPLVPASSAFEYALIAQRAGHAENFVQQYVNKEGHCVFTPGEIGQAFDELVGWVQTGKRPVAGKLPAAK
jgi:pimeloyl-ACP methyl ester carboxylesterase